MYDVLIIGAGVSGSLLAHTLSKLDLSVCLLDKESDVACGASSANSAIIHSGHDPKEGSLKAHYNLLGNRMYKDLCDELQTAYRQVGAFVVATSKEEEGRLEELIANCIRREIPYEVLDGDELRRREKNLSDNVTKGISLPTTGIVTPWEVCIAAVEEFLLNGGEVLLDHEVTAIEKKDGRFLVHCHDEVLETKILVDAAGVYADKIAGMLGVQRYSITPRKGEYYILDHTKEKLVDTIIYPVPSDKGKGVLAVPTIHENILLGPDSEFVPDKDSVATDEGLDYVRRDIAKTVKNIPMGNIIHTFAGLRPTPDTHDFVIGEDEEVENFIHVGGIESPGLTASPAIAEDVKKIIVEKLHPSEKKEYIRRRKPVIMREMSEEEKAELVKKDPDFGKLICRCEKITLGEIKDVIHRPCGAKDVRGVKRRCRPGMGRCQGGFCEVEVLKILSRELNVPMEEISLHGKGTRILVEEAKEELL